MKNIGFMVAVASAQSAVWTDKQYCDYNQYLLEEEQSTGPYSKDDCEAFCKRVDQE